jgi:Tfp pilus assembly protein PilN
LSGGTSKLKNISSELSQRLSITTEPMDVPEGLNIKLSPQRLETFKSDFPMLAPAIGAALSNPEGLNLIPEPYKHRQIKAIQKISIRLVFVITALILITLHLFNSVQEGVFKRLLAAKQPQWEKLQEVGNLHSKIAQKNAMVNQVLKDQVPLYNIFKALSNLVPREIYLQRITIKDGTRSMSMQGIALETPQTAEVIIANFIKQLESSPFFNNVLLASSSDTEIDSKKAVEFEINCGLGKI